MNQDLQQETELKRYLLGELTLEEQVLIEQRLFLDRDYAQLAQAIEDDLIDDYVHDDLTGAERKNFETHFLLKRPEHSEDLRIAQALERYLAFETVTHPATDQFAAIRKSKNLENLREAQAPINATRKDEPAIILPAPRRRKSVVLFALAATVLIVLSLITWIAIRSVRKPGNDPIQARNPQPTPTVTPTQQQSGSPSPTNDNSVKTVDRRTNEPNKKPSNEREERQPEQQPAPTTFAAVTILPGGGSRGGAIKEVVIRPEQRDVGLKLPLTVTKEYERYHLELLSRQRRVHTQTLKSQVDEESGRRIVFISLPVKLFTQRGYEIKLRGITADGRQDQLETYSFTVRKEE